MKHILATLVLLSAAHHASAACVNRFVVRNERPRQIVTLLTGKLTFQEAQTLAAAIEKKQAPPIEWVKEDGKSVAKQFGELKVVRPMPVGCDGKSSGVVLVATFASSSVPSKKMLVKLNADTTVAFEEQSD
jgi:predicted nucleic acid-binding protein